MRTTTKLALFFMGALSANAAMAQPAASPVGYYFSDEECASGGYTYHFCADGSAIAIWEYAEDRPLIKVGTWALKGSDLKITYTDEYAGKGEGEITPAGSVNQYEFYRATHNKLSNETDILTWADNYENGCQQLLKESGAPVCNAQEYLRGGGSTDIYPFTKERLVTESELQKYSKSDLRIMRNEIFARYGYAFKSKDLQAKFGAGSMSDVSAFLSAIETKNVELIKKVENQ